MVFSILQKDVWQSIIHILTLAHTVQVPRTKLQCECALFFSHG